MITQEIQKALGTDYCDTPLLTEDRATAFIDDCNNPSGARIAKIDLATGDISTAIAHRGQALTPVDGGFVYIEPRATEFVVHKYAIVTGGDLALTIAGDAPQKLAWRRAGDPTRPFVVTRDGKWFATWRKGAGRGELITLELAPGAQPHVHDLAQVAGSSLWGHFRFYSLDPKVDPSNPNRVFFTSWWDYRRGFGTDVTRGPAFLLDLGQTPSLRHIASWEPMAHDFAFEGDTLIEQTFSPDNRTSRLRHIDLRQDTATDLGAETERLSPVVLHGGEVIYKTPVAGAPFNEGHGESVVAMSLATGSVRTILTLDDESKKASFWITRHGNYLGLSYARHDWRYDRHYARIALSPGAQIEHIAKVEGSKISEYGRRHSDFQLAHEGRNRANAFVFIDVEAASVQRVAPPDGILMDALVGFDLESREAIVTAYSRRGRPDYYAVKFDSSVFKAVSFDGVWEPISYERASSGNWIAKEWKTRMDENRRELPTTIALSVATPE